MQNKENTTEKYEKELNRERERESERRKGRTTSWDFQLRIFLQSSGETLTARKLLTREKLIGSFPIVAEVKNHSLADLIFFGGHLSDEILSNGCWMSNRFFHFYFYDGMMSEEKNVFIHNSENDSLSFYFCWYKK